MKIKKGKTSFKVYSILDLFILKPIDAIKF